MAVVTTEYNNYNILNAARMSRAAYDEFGSANAALQQTGLSSSGWENVTDRLSLSAGGVSNRYFKNEEAAGLVLQNKLTNSYAIVFRGTDSFFQTDLSDATLYQENHYDKLVPMIDAAVTYFETSPAGTVYITGHSLGGAMVEQLTAQGSSALDDYVSGGNRFQFITFGSVGLADDGTSLPRSAYSHKILNINDSADPAFLALGSRQSGYSLVFDVPFLSYTDTGLSLFNSTWSNLAGGLSAPHKMINYLGTVEDLTSNLNSYPLLQFIGSDLGDQLEGGTSSVKIFGGSGNDTIFGNSAADQIYGNKDRDFIDSGSNNDTVFGGQGNDTISGGSGNDSIFGNSENDWIMAGNGNDYLHGGKGNDIISGDLGNDTIIGGEGNDDLFGGNGGDRFVVDQGRDIVYDFLPAFDFIGLKVGTVVGNLTRGSIFAAAVSEDASGNVIITYNSASIELRGIRKSDVSSSILEFGF